MARTARRIGVFTAGAVSTAIGVAAASPAVRAELRRLRRFARRLDVAAVGAPLPPPLPPGRTVLIPGRGEVFVRDTGGEGPAVLLLHGWGATADLNFFNAYAALGLYRVVALDHRGHGRGLRADSPFQLGDCADDAAALLETLEIDRAVVVGYSMGGPIALLMASRHPQRCAGLVLQATALEFHEGTGEQLLWRGMTVVEAALRHGRGDGVVQRILREAIDREPSLVPYRAWLAGEFRRGHVQSIIEAGRELSRFDAGPLIRGLDVPAAVVLTRTDRLVPPAKQRRLAEALEATVYELAGDHDSCIVDADGFAAATRAAVDRVAERAALASATNQAPNSQDLRLWSSPVGVAQSIHHQ